MGVLRYAQDKSFTSLWTGCQTSNCVLGVSIPSLGVNNVHPLYRVDNKLSMKYIISIISTLVAPEKRPPGRPVSSFAADRRPESPAATTRKNRSQYPGRATEGRSEHPVSFSRSEAERFFCRAAAIEKLVWRLEHSLATRLMKKHITFLPVLRHPSSVGCEAATPKLVLWLNILIKIGT
jgi:hypothetical protein